MIVIAEPYARFRTTLDVVRLEPAASHLLEIAERDVGAYYRRRRENLQVRVAIRIEIGSTRAWIVVSTAFTNLRGQTTKAVNGLM